MSHLGREAMTWGLLSGDYSRVMESTVAENAQSKSLAVKVSRSILTAVYVLVLVLACIVVWQLVARSAEKHIVAWSVAAIFVGISVPLSLHEIHMHLLHWESPLQRYYARILLMVPIYALESWCALRFKQQALFFAVAREAYEALVIRDFFRLMLDALSGGTGDVMVIAAKFRAIGKREAHMLAPGCYLRPWRLDNGEFFKRTQLLVFQYVVVRTTMSIAVFASELAGTFGEGEWTNFNKLFVWNVIIINSSQFIAMWALIMLYHETAELLAPLQPLGKFLAVKAIVFLSFWQGIVLSGLVEVGVLTATADYTQDEVATGMQDFLICIEMAGAAIAHHYTFSVNDFWQQRHKQGALEHTTSSETSPYLPGHGAPKGVANAVAELLPGDILQEAGQHAAALRSAASVSLVAAAQQGRAALGRARQPVWTTSTVTVQNVLVTAGAAPQGEGDHDPLQVGRDLPAVDMSAVSIVATADTRQNASLGYQGRDVVQDWGRTGGQ